MRAVYLAPAAAVLVALGALAGVAELGHPGGADATRVAAATRPVAVTSAERACPPALGGGSGTVALIAGASGPASAASGQLQLTSLPPAGVSLRAASPITAQDRGVLSV